MPNRISDMNRVPCKFFAQGDCLKGEHCLFSHDSKHPSNNSQKICYFYQKGDCAFGSRCRHRHVKASEARMSSSSLASSLQSLALGTRSELSALSSPFLPPSKPALTDPVVHGDGEIVNAKPADRAICSLAAAGDCPRGEKCPDIHGDICPSCGKHCLHPSRPTEREEHIKICEENYRQLEALKRSEEIECCVCLERVLSKPTVAERKFGILSECDHPFCISCIRNWRNSSTRSAMDVNSAYRACPTCRKQSYFVIPSVIWYYTKEEKDEIVDSYKARLRLIDCKHFDSGNGNCPFGSSCFYKHTVKPGSYAWMYNKPPPRRPPPRRSDILQVDSYYDMLEDMLELDDYAPDDVDNVDTSRELQLLTMEELGLDPEELSFYPSDNVDTSWELQLLTMEELGLDSEELGFYPSDNVDTSSELQLLTMEELGLDPEELGFYPSDNVDTSWELPLLTMEELGLDPEELGFYPSDNVDTSWELPLLTMEELGLDPEELGFYPSDTSDDELDYF